MTATIGLSRRRIVPATRTGRARSGSLLDVPIVPLDLLAPTAVSILLFAGFVKGTPALADLPVDLTLVGAVLVVVLGTWDVVMSRSVPHGLAPIVLLWAAFLGGVLSMGGTDYASTKVTRLFSLTLLSAVGAVVLLRTRRRRLIWLWTVMLLGGAVLAVATFAPDQIALESGRLAAEGSNTLATSRAAGAAAVVLIVGAATGFVARIPATALAALSLGAIIATGSRGPLLAVVIAGVAFVLLRPGTFVSRVKRAVIAGIVALGFAVYLLVRYRGGSGFSRIAGTLSGGEDESTDTRLYLAREAWRVIGEQPLGVGWGNFARELPDAGIGTRSTLLEYPHNVFLEVTTEGGWLAGAALLIFLGVALHRLVRASADPVSAAVLALTIFFLVNALVSGDINDNRMLFGAAALGWLPILGREPSATDVSASRRVRPARAATSRRRRPGSSSTSCTA